MVDYLKKEFLHFFCSGKTTDPHTTLFNRMADIISNPPLNPYVPSIHLVVGGNAMTFIDPPIVARGIAISNFLSKYVLRDIIMVV